MYVISMIRNEFIILFFFILFYFLSEDLICQIKEDQYQNNITISGMFEKESTKINDTIELYVQVINISDSIYAIHNNDMFYIKHKEDKGLIFHDNPERISYFIDDVSIYDKTINIASKDTCKIPFNVIIKDSFFYRGDNILYIVYRQKIENSSSIFISNDISINIE